MGSMALVEYSTLDLDDSKEEMKGIRICGIRAEPSELCFISSAFMTYLGL